MPEYKIEVGDVSRLDWEKLILANGDTGSTNNHFLLDLRGDTAKFYAGGAETWRKLADDVYKVDKTGIIGSGKLYISDDKSPELVFLSRGRKNDNNRFVNADIPISEDDAARIYNMLLENSNFSGILKKNKVTGVKTLNSDYKPLKKEITQSQ